MTLYHLILLALIQGITEFLPISSSGHLILLPAAIGTEDQGQFLDVAVHIGTLGAVVLFFWRDVRLGLIGLPKLARGDTQDPGARLALLLMIATIPVVLFGVFLAASGLNDQLRSIKTIGWTMLGFGLLLWWMDRRGGLQKDMADWTLKDAILLGLWQAIALIPGTSRSGITITGARALGYDRESAARIAMLMSIPAILASGGYLLLDTGFDLTARQALDAAIAVALSFGAALLALKFMMMLLRTVSFTPYVIYRVILGAALLFIAYS
ncbi:undecaprenyl-diphosphate phosphatase [Cognatishimia sp. SS12]|uniref:undecaprenyl-diphosphate phosphatase n=1 Tax=Cognatishimia sp. SS12 TaxID=2979465 RepID=UPI00232AEB65|nr:undecaprenyl-diphosphate phosphatase [Cognatishimia sp. SS12]MDC0737798.1 undecaprenyl-diphosphate phosphatase [Cognatishimia sp. SS12]